MASLLLGGGKLESELRDWAAKYPDNRVRVLTDVSHDRVAPYVAAMDILAAPSQTTRTWKEQFGRMLIEGMACGVAVVGSDSGEIPYVIGDAGVVVGEVDISGWSRALGDLLDNPARRAELGARPRVGREFVCLAHRGTQASGILRDNPGRTQLSDRLIRDLEASHAYWPLDSSSHPSPGANPLLVVGEAKPG